MIESARFLEIPRFGARHDLLVEVLAPEPAHDLDDTAAARELVRVAATADAAAAVLASAPRAANGASHDLALLELWKRWSVKASRTRPNTVPHSRHSMIPPSMIGRHLQVS